MHRYDGGDDGGTTGDWQTTDDGRRTTVLGLRSSVGRRSPVVFLSSFVLHVVYRRDHRFNSNNRHARLLKMLIARGKAYPFRLPLK